MPAIRHKFTKPFTVTWKTKMRPPLELTLLKEGALLLANSDVASRILRAAAAETLMEAYRKRFLAALPGMVNTRREHRRRRDARLTGAVRQQFLKAARRVDMAELGGDAAAISSARANLQRIREDVRRSVKPPNPSRRPLPHGMFRGLAMRVLELVSDVYKQRTFMSGNDVVLGIGSLSALDRIRTPSATQKLTGSPTTSPRSILWRHLEFGTGAFSTRPQDQSQEHRLPSGGWWYGKSPDESLELRGSRPGKFMFDPARKAAHALPYEADSVRFQSVLYQMITRVLSQS